MVNPIIGGALIGGAAQLLGARGANRANRRENALDRQHQLNVARNTVRWRMEDARRAGVSPYAAMGVSPVSASGTSRPMQNELAGLGQGIASAGRSMQTATQRKADQLNLENMKLNNDLLRSQVAASQQALVRANRPSMLPPTHASASHDGSEITTHRLNGSSTLPSNASVADISRLAEAAIVRAPEVTGSSPKNPLITAGHHPAYSYIRTRNGYMVVPSEDLKERVEDSPQEWQSWLRMLGSPKEHKPHWSAGNGRYWFWNPFMSTWVARKEKPRIRIWD